MAATDPEAQALGYQLPTGTSLIRDGDDAISNNARVAAGLHITLKNRVDALAADDTTDVDSVNGHTGAVTLTAADVGAMPDTYIPTWGEVSDKPTNFPPTGHASRHATGGSDPITPASIGAAAVSPPNIDASVVDILQLPDGNYGQPLTSGATTARGFPEGAVAGWLQLRSVGSPDYMRWATYTAFAGAPGNGRFLTWENRKYSTSGWSGWVPTLGAGTGSPEGVVTAPVGTEYTDRTGTNGAWKWMKRSGTGSTGWVVTEGDTGWRSLPGGTKVKRDASSVFVQFYRNLPAGTGTVDADTLPAGFRPRWHIGEGYFIGALIQRCHVLTSGTVRFYDVSASGAFVTLAVTYSTTDPWPTTLPGIPD